MLPFLIEATVLALIVLVTFIAGLFVGDRRNVAATMLMRSAVVLVEPLQNRLDRMEREQRIGHRWNVMLSDQVREMGGRPVTYEEAAQAEGIIIERDPDRDLRIALTEHFNLDELHLLVRDCGWKPDEIAGDTLSRRAQSLIDYAHRRGQVATLREAIVRVRPRALEQT